MGEGVVYDRKPRVLMAGSLAEFAESLRFLLHSVRMNVERIIKRMDMGGVCKV